MLETIVKLILRGSLAAAVAAAAVMLIRLPLKKAPKRWSYLLWAVVFFRCLCPLSVESAVSIFNAVPEQSIYVEQVSDNYEYVPVDYDPVYVDYSGNADFNKSDVREKPVQKNSGSVYTILFIIWVSGAAVMLLYAVISYVRLMMKMKTAIKTEDGIYETDMVSTAFSAGLFPPKIFLPCGLSEKERELIIAHERVHIRRLDFIFKPLAFAGLALHWFDPMIWVSFALMTKDMELSCDEAVLKMLGAAEKKSYSNALLKVSMKRSGLTALPLAFAGSGIKERVKNVLGYKKSGIIATVIAAVVVLTAGAVLGTDAVRNSDVTGGNPETRIWYNNNFLDDYAAVTNTDGEMFFIQYRGIYEDTDAAGLKNLVVYNYDDRGIVFENRGPGTRDVDIYIDPEKIEKVVIQDLRLGHYDDYDGDGINDDLTYIAADMELFMTEDNDKSPEVQYSGEYINLGNTKVQTVMCGGNAQRYGIYAEMEIVPSTNGFTPEYVLSGYGIKLVGFGDAEIYIADNLKIADFNFPVVEAHDDTDDTFKVDQDVSNQEGKIEEERMRLEEEKRRKAEQARQQESITLKYPVEDHTISASYKNSTHKGIDFAVPKGTPVYASADGTVTETSTGWSNGYGNMIMIDHGNELTTLYAHLDELIAEEGDEVKAGDLIGYVGSTGNVYGATLHFEVRVAEGQHTDPMAFLEKID